MEESLNKSSVSAVDNLVKPSILWLLISAMMLEVQVIICFHWINFFLIGWWKFNVMPTEKVNKDDWLIARISDKSMEVTSLLNLAFIKQFFTIQESTKKEENQFILWIKLKLINCFNSYSLLHLNSEKSKFIWLFSEDSQENIYRPYN